MIAASATTAAYSFVFERLYEEETVLSPRLITADIVILVN